MHVYAVASVSDVWVRDVGLWEALWTDVTRKAAERVLRLIRRKC
jgi:hypothetical protein